MSALPDDPGRQPATRLWEQRFRGCLPLSNNSVSDSGEVLVLRPDDVDRRVHEGLAINPRGEVRSAVGLSVETVRRLEVSCDGALVVGLTGTSIYLFRGGKRTRLLADRRVEFTALALARDAPVLIYGCSDQTGSSHWVGYLQIEKGTNWERPSKAPVACVAVAPDGERFVVGSADGSVISLTRARSAVWERALPKAATSLAIGSDGMTAVASEDGRLIALAPDGQPRWEVEAGAPAIALATDATSRWVVAGIAGSARRSLLCLDMAGQILWDYPLDGQPEGIAMSPDGTYLAVSLADGRVLCYATDFEALAGTSSGTDPALAEAQALLDEGEYIAARRRLLRRLAYRPDDVAVGALLVDVETRYVSERSEAAHARAHAGEYGPALALLSEAQAILPYHQELFEERLRLRREGVAHLEEQATSLEAEGRRSDAAGRLRQLLELDPCYQAARERLAALGADIA